MWLENYINQRVLQNKISSNTTQIPLKTNLYKTNNKTNILNSIWRRRFPDPPKTNQWCMVLHLSYQKQSGERFEWRFDSGDASYTLSGYCRLGGEQNVKFLIFTLQWSDEKQSGLNWLSYRSDWIWRYPRFYFGKNWVEFDCLLGNWCPACVRE